MDKPSGNEDRIALAQADPLWRDQFLAEAASIRSVCSMGIAYRIEHFGSTAVAGIAAKPIIDMLLIPPAGVEWTGLISPLESLGYIYWADNPRKDRMFFVKGMPPFGSGRTHHIHVRTAEDGIDELLFRDYLIAHTEIAIKYEALKKRLAVMYPTDREAYTDGKNDFIASVLLRAKE